MKTSAMKRNLFALFAAVSVAPGGAQAFLRFLGELVGMLKDILDQAAIGEEIGVVIFQ